MRGIMGVLDLIVRTLVGWMLVYIFHWANVWVVINGRMCGTEWREICVGVVIHDRDFGALTSFAD